MQRNDLIQGSVEMAGLASHELQQHSVDNFDDHFVL